MSDPVARLNSALEGRYRIESELGEGGMATVYLADDLKHERKVALKVLKPELAAVVGAERFLAEIKTTANLQHPNILPLFDSGQADSFLFYVMPYVEGETLQDKLKRERQLPVEEAVGIATEVADALQAAHEAGVVHRDIKPANILLSRGRPLVADFGIALAVTGAAGTRLTETGLSVGTPHYMSPEQATGEEHVGPAADTYALGCVLYEMLVGEPPYTGATAQAILGRIIMGGPASATEHRSSVPAHVDGAIRKALEKLPADRFTSAKDFARALADPGFSYGASSDVGARPTAGPWKAIAIATSGIAAVMAAILGVQLTRAEPEFRPPISRFSGIFQEGQEVAGDGVPWLSSDGSTIVYSALSPLARPQLALRRLDQLDSRLIPGTEGAIAGVLSPNGREVAFVAGFPGPLGVVDLEGGPARTLSPLSYGVSDWNDGYVYYSAPIEDVLENPVGNYRISQVGGNSELLSAPQEGESGHIGLRVYPETESAVFQVFNSFEGKDAEIWSLDLATGATAFLADGGGPAFSQGLLFIAQSSQGSVMAAPFDPVSLELTGPLLPVLENVSSGLFGLAYFAVSESGTLLYRKGDSQPTSASWVDLSGGSTPVDPDWSVADVTATTLSPEGGRVAYMSGGDIWVKGLDRGPQTRITFERNGNMNPTWSPDGDSLVFVSNRLSEQPDHYDVFTAGADGAGEATLLYDDARSVQWASWSPVGEWLLVETGSELERGIFPELKALRPGIDSVPFRVTVPRDVEQGPRFSPDGRWIVYTMWEQDVTRVYVKPFPEVNSGRWQISPSSGMDALWSQDGTTIYYRDGVRGGSEAFYAATVRTDPSFSVLGTREIFRRPVLVDLFRNFDLAPDGDRFFMLELSESAGGGWVLVQNWLEEVEARLERR